MKTKLFPVALFCCFAFLMPLTTCAAAEELPILSVSGNGMVQSAPDQAAVTMGLVTRAETAGDAQQENAIKATAIRNALIEIGIEEKDIKTDEYSFKPEYSRERNERNIIVGYTASNTIRVHVRNVALASDVIDAALSNGANTVYSLDFSIRDTDALRKKALENAVKDARSKADAIAHALGKSIVGVHHVSENTGMFQPRQSNTMMMKSMDAVPESTPIDAGTLSLTADVHIDFILSR